MVMMRKFLVISVSLTMVCLITLAIYILTRSTAADVTEPDLLTNYYNNDESTNCLAPKANFWDPVYLKFYRRRTLNCPFKKPLTTINDDGLITLTIEGRYSTISCFATTIRTAPGHDNVTIYSARQLIGDQGVQLTANQDIANVTCFDDERQVYINTHYFIPDFNSTTVEGSDRPSVLVFHLESLSAGSFHRFMPKTQEALRSLGHFQELEGFVKPVDNSFPNSMALMAGKIVGEQPAFLKSVNKKYFDGSAPFIWEDFKRKGYVTGFQEDGVLRGIFNYLANGFDKKPVDWMPRSYWLQMNPGMTNFDPTICNDPKNYCFEKNGAKVELFLNQTRAFAKKMTIKRQAYFLWTFHSLMTHDFFDAFQMVDEPIAKFFEGMKPYLKNTVIIFAGDHGPRVGAYPMTMLGRLEERMTYVTVRTPQELDDRYPHLRRNLERNRGRLTSYLDVHKMLQNIARGEFGEVPESTSTGPINLIREVVSLNRSCRDAMIQKEFCVCDGRINLVTKSIYSLGVPEPKVIATYVNQLIARSPNCSLRVAANKFENLTYVMNRGKSFMVEHLEAVISLRSSSLLVAKTFRRDHRRGTGFQVLKNSDEDAKIVASLCD